MKRFDIGNSDFKSVIQNDNYYVDKSLFIKEIIDTQKQVLLVLRPRRFGKTMNLKMLRTFFEKDVPENEKLFINLKIWQSEKEILDKRGKYPVIYLTFKDAKGNNWEDVYNHIISEIYEAYTKHHYLINSNVLESFEKEDYNSILYRKAGKSNYEKSLRRLCEYLYRYHKEKVVILIDEYDTSILSSYTKFYEDVISFMRNLLSGAFKDNDYLYKGVLTGILRVSKESIFSGLNNIGVYTILEQEFADKFGFTEDEVKGILDNLQLSSYFPDVKKWYDGYTIGDKTDIYNPWSILNYAVGYKNGFKPYWVNTSSDDLLREQIKNKNSNEEKEVVFKLTNGETIQKTINENFVFPDMKKKKDLIWTLLFFSGYLTQVRQISLSEYELKVPNYELKLVFQNIIIDWFESEITLIKTLLYETANHLISNRLDKFSNGFKKIIGEIMMNANNRLFAFHKMVKMDDI